MLTRISDRLIEELIEEDMPYVDLTTYLLDIGDRPATMNYYTREACTVCCTEECGRVVEKLGGKVESFIPSGTKVEAGETLLVATGSAQQLHAAWKVGLNLLDHTSAVATKTAKMVETVHEIDPRVEILTTRKSMPGTKSLMTKAVITGGAFPHRLGLSETVLVFDNHKEFLLGNEIEVAQQIAALRDKVCEKKIFVEAGFEEALVLARAGVDGIQVDKLPVEELSDLVVKLRQINPNITITAAGGINPGNAAAYAATGVNGLVTTALFSAKPLDMSANIRPA